MQEILLAQSDGDTGTLIIYALLAVLAGGLAWFGWWMRKKKIAHYRAWAAQYGFHYEPRDDSVVGLSSEDPFENGRARQGLDVFRGRYKNLHIVFFQYNYTTGSGKESQTHSNQVVAIGLPTARPLLDIRQENAFSKRFQKDIDFENQRFNDTFRVKSPNRRFAFDIIHARTMEWMLADQRAMSYPWRFEGPWLMTYRSGALNLQEVFFYADFLIDVYAQVPRHVWSNQ